MSKRIARLILVVIGLVLLCSTLFAQSLNEPIDVRTRQEKVKDFIDALKQGDPESKAFIFITYDLLAGKAVNPNGLFADGARVEEFCKAYKEGKTQLSYNVIDTIRCGALDAGFKDKNYGKNFMDYLTDGEFSTLGEKSEKRKNIVISTLRGLYNLDPRIRLIAIEWLRVLRPDAMMYRDVERAVEYETVCSSYEKYRPKDIDIPSIDEPGVEGINVPFSYYYPSKGETAAFEETMNVVMTNVDKDGNLIPAKDDNVAQTDPRPTATQLDARKWGNGYPFDPDKQLFEIYTYIDVMTAAGVLRRFRNVKDSYLLGYQYQLGANYSKNYNGKSAFQNRPFNSMDDPAHITPPYYDSAKKEYLLDNLTAAEIVEILQTMVPIGHGSKYYYRNTNGYTVIGNSWAELIKLREFIVRAIWYDKIKKGELNSLVIISKDTFKTLYLSIDGEVGYDVPFLATTDTTPGGPKLTQEDIPVLAQGLLKNPVFSTKWVIARALKDIYSQKATTPENKKKINVYLRQAKYDALAKDYINGAILHEELIKVGKIDISQYPTYDMTIKIIDSKGNDVTAGKRISAIYAGGVYIPTLQPLGTAQTIVTKVTSFTMPNDEVLPRSTTNDSVKLTIDENYGKTIKDIVDNMLKYGEGENPEVFDLRERVIDAFTFYDFYVIDEDPAVPRNQKKGYREQKVSSYDASYNTGLDSYNYGENVNTVFNNRLEYMKAKEVYYKRIFDELNGSTYIKDISAIEHVLPGFNIGHYNRVVNFINEVLNGNDVMRETTWDIVESAELLIMYRLYRMIDKATVGATLEEKARLLTLAADNSTEPRVNFFDAFVPGYIAKLDEKNTQRAIAGKTIFDYAKVFAFRNFTTDRKNIVPSFEELDSVTEDSSAFKTLSGSYTFRPMQTYSPAKRNNLVKAAFSGIYNKDGRIRVTAIHWLRRLGPDKSMYDDVRKALGVLAQQEISVKTLDDLDNKFRKDRPDTQRELVPFLDTNTYRRLDRNEYFADLLATNPADANYNAVWTAKSKYLHPDFLKLKSGSYDCDAQGKSTGVTAINDVTFIRPMLYMVSQDFEILTYRPLQVESLAEEVNFYDMLPGYDPNHPDLEVRLPQLDNLLAQLYTNEDCPVFDTIIQVITLANPLYTEERYEYYFDSFGTYEYKSPMEELHKLYKLIRREMLVDSIKEGGKDVNFENIVRFDFRVLSSKIDDEYLLRVPMQSFFGLVGNGRDSLDSSTGEVPGQNYVLHKDFLDPSTGDFDTRYAFRMPKGKDMDIYPKYPIFREKEVSLVARGFKNSNFIVQKGTVAFLVKFYNYYSNLDASTKSAVRDSMYQYKLEDIAVEEVTLAFEGEDPDGRVVIKAGTKLGNDLNSGGVAQYKKNIPLEIRKSLRQMINNDIQSFNNEISDIIGIIRSNRGRL